MLWPQLAAAYITQKLKPIQPQSDAEVRPYWGSCLGSCRRYLRTSSRMPRASCEAERFVLLMGAGGALQPQVGSGGKAGAEGSQAAPAARSATGWTAWLGQLVSCSTEDPAQPSPCPHAGSPVVLPSLAPHHVHAFLPGLPAADKEGPISRYIKHTLNRFLNLRRNRCDRRYGKGAASSTRRAICLLLFRVASSLACRSGRRSAEAAATMCLLLLHAALIAGSSQLLATCCCRRQPRMQSPWACRAASRLPARPRAPAGRCLAPSSRRRTWELSAAAGWRRRSRCWRVGSMQSGGGTAAQLVAAALVC